MYASFAQYVGAVVLDEEAIAKSIVDSAANAAAALQSKKPAKKLAVTVVNKSDMSASEPFLGKLLVMGNVTKKLVITPDFPIGKDDEDINGNSLCVYRCKLLTPPILCLAICIDVILKYC